MTFTTFVTLYMGEHNCALELLAVGCLKGAEECLELAQGVLDRFNEDGEDCIPEQLEVLEQLLDTNVRTRALVLRAKKTLAAKAA
jgi:hypothetical protein